MAAVSSERSTELFKKNGKEGFWRAYFMSLKNYKRAQTLVL
jgi:hypothetical protein|tara:strand:- start:138 stop:260 length:123 start_codon:yes stop_codon:yes gene_type:complete